MTEPPENANHGWRSLLVIGSVAALVAAIVFRRWLGSEYSLLATMGIFRAGPKDPPSAVADWFALLHTNKLVGLALLNAFDLVNYALVGLIFLGLYGALRRSNKAMMTFALLLGFLGIGIYFASNQAFPLLALSDQYAAASTVQQSAILATGQTLLAISDHAVFGTGVFWGFVFVTLSGLIISIVMLRSGPFGKWTSGIGILANALGLGYFFTLALAPSLTFIPLSASAPFLLAWYIMISLKLFRLAKRKIP